MSQISSVFAGRRNRFDSVLLRHLWFIALIVTLGGFGTWGADHLQPPVYEASAVVQVKAGTEAARVATHILGRDNLAAIAIRHGLTRTDPASRDRAAVGLAQSVVLNALTAASGQSMGFPPQLVGLVVSVQLPDAERAARVANDVAQQILDAGNAGQLDATQDDLDFYRRDETRLWQELSALESEQNGQSEQGQLPEPDLVARRQLALMQDQYDALRHKLAEAEIATRLSANLQQGQFVLLRRALASESAAVDPDWLPIGVLASLVLAIALAFVRDYQTRPTTLDLTPLHQGAARLYRQFDDPARPVMGLPRYAVAAGLLAASLYIVARWIG